jgi:putative PIN family toxin of toxin-antitoxin system
MRCVVLDTNVLVSAVINPRGTPAQVLGAWRAGRFVLAISVAILEEVDRVLHYPKVTRFHQWPEERLRTLLEDLAHLAQLAHRTPGTREVRAVERDPTDNRFLECALEGQAEFLVTGDQHLLGLGRYEGAQIATPAAFWELLASEPEPR